jgi:hypothetical protein
MDDTDDEQDDHDSDWNDTDCDHKQMDCIDGTRPGRERYR